MKNNIQQTTFWNFLQKRKIEIPIIQRDYAQGRIGKEFLREKFLKDIKDSLDKDDRILKLDFVYGSIEDDKLNPLDGQQRLTTLWLLYWYIAFKCGEIENQIETFKHFSYETRISSREFCSKLSEFNSDSQDSSSNIIKVIKEQTWFLTEWEQDPTIQAMLTMLGGTDIMDKNNYDPADGLEEVFDECTKDDFENYWQILTGKKCPIIFYYLDLIDLALSDDLYIKMNARGKALTDFENFKADLVGFYKENEEETPSQTMAHKLDNSWTNIFWKFKSNGNRIDEIYFAFINRYLLNKLIANSALSAENIEKDFLFKYLYGKNGDDNVVEYHGFDLYKGNNNINLKEIVNSLKNLLDSFDPTIYSNNDIETIIKNFEPSWGDNTFHFFPVYNSDGKLISKLTQSQRVIFHAICCYFENPKKYEETSFKQWMRVIWNIVENAGIDGISKMISAIRLVQSLAEFSHNIYDYLRDLPIKPAETSAEEQMKEEKEKARQICLNNDTDEKVSEWERKIIEAEGTAFFKGAIRFLFRKDSTYDWSVFENRLEKAKIYFNSRGVNEINKSSIFLLKVLISKFDHFDHFKDTIFDNNKESWKKILIKNELIEPINRFFEINEIEKYDLQNYLTEIPEIDANGNNNSRLIFFQNDLCLSDILSVLSPRSYFHLNHERYSLFPHNTKSQKKIFVLADMRNKILSELESDNTISIDEKNRIENMPYFRGWQIHFTSDGKKYELWKTLKVQNEETMEWIEVKEKVNKLKNLLEYVS